MLQLELGSLIISILTLLSLFYSIASVIQKQKREWSNNEQRLLSIEKSIYVLLDDSKHVAEVSIKLDGINTEITRLRDRIDRFLDGGNRNG